MCLRLNVFVFARTLRFSAPHYQKCFHIMFLQPHITKNACRDYTDRERAVMWTAFSPRYLGKKQAHNHFILLQNDIYNLYLKESPEFMCPWSWTTWFYFFHDIIFFPCFLSGILVSAWSHDSPFCVNVTPACILGNVRLKKRNVHTNTFKHKQTFYNTYSLRNEKELQYMKNIIHNESTTRFFHWLFISFKELSSLQLLQIDAFPQKLRKWWRTYVCKWLTLWKLNFEKPMDIIQRC